MKKKLFVAGMFAASLAAFPVSVGSNPAFASSASIDTTGPGSFNSITIGYGGGYGGWSISNSTGIDFDNDSDQEATSGNASVTKNTTGGDAETGDAMNDNSLVAGIMIDNSGSHSSGSGCNGCGSDVDASIENTGPHSENVIHVGGGSSCNNSCNNSCNSSCGSNGNGINNDTDISIDNDSDQKATSGNAKVYKNTTGGDATTGNASNDNETDVEIEIDNSGSHHGSSGCNNCGSGNATIDTTGPGSVNSIHIGSGSCCGSSSVSNNSNVSANNSSNQNAQSGNASVSTNTTGGNASTGSASNSNSSSFSFSISN